MELLNYNLSVALLPLAQQLQDQEYLAGDYAAYVSELNIFKSAFSAWTGYVAQYDLQFAAYTQNETTFYNTECGQQPL